MCSSVSYISKVSTNYKYKSKSFKMSEYKNLRYKRNVTIPKVCALGFPAEGGTDILSYEICHLQDTAKAVIFLLVGTLYPSNSRVYSDRLSLSVCLSVCP